MRPSSAERAVEPRAKSDVNQLRAVAVELTGVDVSYGSTTVVDDAMLAIERGELISLLGPSGCGKTTLLRAIAGLNRIDRGSISLDGTVVSTPDAHRKPEQRNVGMVFQDGALFPHLTVAENVRFGIRKQPNADTRVAEVLSLTGMSDTADRLPGTLSGGQQQRVALARALAPEPDVLLLDEPFSALDATLRVQLRRDVRDILRDIEVTSILVTHDQDEAFSLGDRVAVMHAGSVLQVGTPVELYERPATPWVASFVGEANELPGTFSGGRVQTAIGDFAVRLDAAEGERVTTIVRPEQLAVRAGSTARIAAVEYFGHDARYEVEIGDLRIGVRAASVAFGVDEGVDLDFIGDSVPAWRSVAAS